MLINPWLPDSKPRLETIPGTRIIIETFGVVGADVVDPANPNRRWTVSGLYAPIRGRAVGGVRAKLYDQKEFVSFCNQRDFEVLLGLASPGSYCPWLDQYYVEPGEREWLGLCIDEQDLIDDLYDRELEARALYEDGGVLPDGLRFTRRIHASAESDFEELMVLLADADYELGIAPDLRIETITNRWASVERTAQRERGKLWLRL